jgi:glycosyltransferase involved in cell wall biosynthesis
MKIHLVGNSPYVSSGFGKVGRYIATGLKKLGHDVTATGIQTALKVGHEFGIDCYPIDTGGHIDETGQLFLNLQKINPDVVIYVGQLDADTNNLAKVFRKTISYSPVEGKDIPIGMVNDMRYVIQNGGRMVAQCFYGQSEMKKVGIDSACIYHGYDPDIFYKMEKDKFEPYCYYNTGIGKINTDPEALCRQGCYHCRDGQPITNTECPYYKEEIVSILKWDNDNKRWSQNDIGISKLKDDSSFRGKFVYLFLGNNFGVRKRIERLLRAFSIMINESRQLKDKTHLHLHTLPISIQGVNLIKVIGDLGIENNVSFSYGSFGSSGWSEESIAWLYNCIDVNISASSGEGFGLATIESMACGKANVAPNCSSFTELIGDGERDPKNARGYLALIESEAMIQDGSIRSLVDQEHLAIMLKKMYVDKRCRERFEKNAIQFAEQYSWDRICNQWNDLLKTL